MSEKTTFKEWSILELMGHRRLAGMLSEMQLGGASFLRIDIPQNDKYVTQFYSPQAVYCITPTDERTARMVAKEAEAPVSRWELAQLMPPQERESDEEIAERAAQAIADEDAAEFAKEIEDEDEDE